VRRWIIDKSQKAALTATGQTFEREVRALAALHQDAPSTRVAQAAVNLASGWTATQGSADARKVLLTRADGAWVCVYLGPDFATPGGVTEVGLAAGKVVDGCAIWTGAVWLWDATDGLPTPDQLVGWLAGRNVDTVFLGRGWVPTDDAYVSALSTAAHALGMTLYAAGAGGADWWAPRATAGADWTQRMLGTGFYDGVHLDLEPWADGTDATELADYLAALRSVHAVTEAAGKPLDVATHPLLDDHADANGSFLAQVTAVADSTTVLAFRDTAPAIESRSAAALGYARAAGKPVRLGLSVEPAAVAGDPSATFAEQGSSGLDAAMSALASDLSGDPAFAGFAVQSYEYWRTLP
jgi:hypothetical protein